jgi:hypothetical protein
MTASLRLATGLTVAYYRKRLRNTVRATLKTLARWWEAIAGPRWEFATDEQLITWAGELHQFRDDRGHCAVCGEDHALNRDGRVRSHGQPPCPGSKELPGKMLMEMTT